MKKLSILIPTLNVCQMLKACLESIEQYTPAGTYEIIIADNASSDGTLEMLQRDFPDLKVLTSDKNEGFSKPVNRLLKAATGEYLVLLNPDTLLIEDVFSPQLDWLAENEEVGICIPKVLNSDGTFQAQSKRGDAKPAAVFGYFLGLGKLFPQNRPLNSYLMSWLDEDEISEVDAVSGSCMIIRRECWEQVGDFDEAFFRLSGRQRLLHPCPKSWLEGHVRAISAIIHYGGQGGSKARLINQSGSGTVRISCFTKSILPKTISFCSTGFTMP